MPYSKKGTYAFTSTGQTKMLTVNFRTTEIRLDTVQRKKR